MGDLSDLMLRDDRELSRVRGGVGGEWPGERETLERAEPQRFSSDDAINGELEWLGVVAQ